MEISLLSIGKLLRRQQGNRVTEMGAFQRKINVFLNNGK